jgi:predicted TIM-barrel fold metal-dependent hydrolase
VTMDLLSESPVPIIDTFLQLHEGTSHIVPMMPREALRDDYSLARWPDAQMVGYLFRKDAELDERERIASDLTLWLENLARWNIAAAGFPLTSDTPNEYFDRLSEHQDRLFTIIWVYPHTGMKDVRRIDELARKYKFVRSVSLSPYGIYPQIAPDSKEYYPLYAKCCELGIAVNVNVGFPGPRVPAWTQNPMALDEVCWFFPELTVIMRHGGEPWEDIVVKMLLRWPNCYFATTAFAPRYYPRAIIDLLNTRGSDKVIYAGYFPLISFERSFAELAQLGLRDHVWPKFLNENARRAFRLDEIPGFAGTPTHGG